MAIILKLTLTEKIFHLLFEGTTWNVRGERCICNYARHLENFLDLSTRELMFYMQQRALTCHGNHADLAVRVLVSIEQNLLLQETAETLLFTLQREYSDIFKCCSLTEDPLEMEDWNDKVLKWPKVHTFYCADLRLCFKERGQYKDRKVFSFYTERSMWRP